MCRPALENDGDASVLGESTWGAGQGKSRLIYVTVGTGIGGGIIIDGHLYRGADRSHPEVGHHVIDASGPQCTCGFRGCWEALGHGKSRWPRGFKRDAVAAGRKQRNSRRQGNFPAGKIRRCTGAKSRRPRTLLSRLGHRQPYQPVHAGNDRARREYHEKCSTRRPSRKL